MSAMSRAVQSYYRANVHAWQALRRTPLGRLPGVIGLYLAITLGLNASGHLAAAWIATVVLGLPLLVAGWMA
ncbi:hypothetical protein ABZV65_19530 [Streptomyces bauhiniae]|uniref:hypothetical protein n=1 Tax=Streptomyces bauhiniae TaxID=2340725 RepID=UPI0033A5F3E4